MTRVTKIDRDGVGAAALERCSVVPVDAVLSGFADELGAVHFESPDGTLVIGTWQSTPYAEMLTNENSTEYSSILSGKVAITNPDGSVETFGAGERYVLPAGVTVRFEVTETMRKVYVLVTDKGAS
jgi:uncharacterized cupin superfamily protein